MIETVAVDEWLYQTMSADSTLTALASGGVHADVAPPDSTLPAVVFSDLGGADTVGVDGTRILTSGLWLVRAIAEATSWQGTLRQAADRIDAVLDNTSGVVSGVTVGKCSREAPHKLVDTAHGRQYRHLGGTYRIVLYPT